MEIDYRHFASNKLPGDIIKMIGLFEKINPLLKELVFRELEEGNIIYDVTMDYPEPGSVHISMQSEFMLRHELKEVTYNELQDHHYWKGEYSVGKPAHLVTCPF